MKILKAIARRLLRILEGKRKYQRFFGRLHDVAIAGMNYGKGDEFTTSGELVVLRHVHSSLVGVPEDIVLFDVGANLGGYTKALLDQFRMPNVRIHSFEPSLPTYRRLVDNVGGFAQVKTHNIGLSDETASRELYTSEGLPGLASVHERRLAHRNITMKKSEAIQVRTLDDFCAEQGIDRIHFLKMDVEGHELSVLKGGARMLEEGRIFRIQWEFGGTNIDSRTFFQDFFYLLKDRYDISRVVSDGLFAISRYSESLEIFSTINYFASLRA